MSKPANEISKSPDYRRPGRPAREDAVIFRAIDELFFAGQPISHDAVAARARASKRTVSPVIKEWMRRLPDRVQRGPEAFERIPAAVAHLLETLYLSCLEQARRSAQQEDKHSRDKLQHSQQTIDVREHVLALRESELTDRLKRRDDTIALLEPQLKDQALQLRKLQASKDSLQRRIDDLQAELERTRAARKIAGPVAKPRKKATKRKQPSAAARTGKSPKRGTKLRRGRRR